MSLTRREVLKGMGALAIGSTLVSPKYLFAASPQPTTDDHLSTFSIVAYDSEIQAWGVAVTSKFLAVGAIVPLLGIADDLRDADGRLIGGAIANQAYPDVNAAPIGLQVLLDGGTAQEALDAILAATTSAQLRQFGVVDSQGNTAVHTGSSNPRWAGHVQGDGFVVQGNTLAGKAVVDAVAEYYTNSEEDFWYRLFNALKAGEAEGGDKRQVGRDAIANSAAIKIVGYNQNLIGTSTDIVDLRVDNADNPLEELEELMSLWFSVLNPEPMSPPSDN